MLPKTHMSFHVLCCFLPLPLNRAAAANDYVPVHNYTTQRANGVVSDNVEIFPHPTMRARQAAALWWALRKFPSTTLDQTPAYSCLGRRSIKQNHTQRETSSGSSIFHRNVPFRRNSWAGASTQSEWHFRSHSFAAWMCECVWIKIFFFLVMLLFTFWIIFLLLTFCFSLSKRIIIKRNVMQWNQNASKPNTTLFS